MEKKSAKMDLPKTLYVYRDDDSYLIAHGTARECASLEEHRIIGVYHLARVGTVVAEVRELDFASKGSRHG